MIEWPWENRLFAPSFRDLNDDRAFQRRQHWNDKKGKGRGRFHIVAKALSIYHIYHDLFTLKDLSKCYFKKHKEGIYLTKYCKEIVLTLTESKESTRIYQASGYIVHAHILKWCPLCAIDTL